eukprot:SAG11_NODE_2098_length_3827_cov_2.481223_2_plen_71_part_00
MHRSTSSVITSVVRSYLEIWNQYLYSCTAVLNLVPGFANWYPDTIWYSGCVNLIFSFRYRVRYSYLIHYY